MFSKFKKKSSQPPLIRHQMQISFSHPIDSRECLSSYTQPGLLIRREEDTILIRDLIKNKTLALPINKELDFKNTELLPDNNIAIVYKDLITIFDTHQKKELFQIPLELNLPERNFRSMISLNLQFLLMHIVDSDHRQEDNPKSQESILIINLKTYENIIIPIDTVSQLNFTLLTHSQLAIVSSKQIFVFDFDMNSKHFIKYKVDAADFINDKVHNLRLLGGWEHSNIVIQTFTKEPKNNEEKADFGVRSPNAIHLHMATLAKKPEGGYKLIVNKHPLHSVTDRAFSQHNHPYHVIGSCNSIIFFEASVNYLETPRLMEFNFISGTLHELSLKGIKPKHIDKETICYYPPIIFSNFKLGIRCEGVFKYAVFDLKSVAMHFEQKKECLRILSEKTPLITPLVDLVKEYKDSFSSVPFRPQLLFQPASNPPKASLSSVKPLKSKSKCMTM